MAVNREAFTRLLETRIVPASQAPAGIRLPRWRHAPREEPSNETVLLSDRAPPPTPEEIAERAAAIRATWPRCRLRRNERTRRVVVQKATIGPLDGSTLRHGYHE